MLSNGLGDEDQTVIRLMWVLFKYLQMEAPRGVIVVLEGAIANTQLSKNDPLLHVRLKKNTVFPYQMVAAFFRM